VYSVGGEIATLGEKGGKLGEEGMRGRKIPLKPSELLDIRDSPEGKATGRLENDGGKGRREKGSNPVSSRPKGD